MQIGRNTVVSIDYTLTNDAGEVLDSSRDAEPLAYIHGVGQIVPGLETALTGKGVGDAFQIRLPAGEAYGDRDPELVHTATRAQFGGDDPEIGMQVSADGPDGAEVLTIVAIEGDEVTLDGNHPLAGLPLTFAITVVGVRPATKEELAHGHPHGAGGHSH